MKKCNLSTYPNQTFFVIIDGVEFHFRLHYFREVLYADLTVDNELVAGSVRCVPNGWLFSKAHTKGCGNFRFETYQNKYPNSEDFGTTCYFVYYTQDEIDELEAS
jgi:hypothetical protein